MNDFDKSKNDSDKRNSNNVQSGTESMDTTNGTALEHSEVADVAMSENLLGKRAISEVEVSTDGDSTGSGTVPAPKKGTGKPASRARKATPSESTRRPPLSSSLSRRSR